MIVLTADAVTVARCTTRQPCERCSDDYTRMVSRETHRCSPPMLQGFVTTATEPPVKPGDRIALAATPVWSESEVADINDAARFYGQPEDAEFHPGHIVATATVAAVLPITDGDPDDDWCVPQILADDGGITVYDALLTRVAEIDDHRHLADWSPGRWAVELVDVTLTTERCPNPACKGRGWTLYTPARLSVCTTCGGEQAKQSAGKGSCPPIPHTQPGEWGEVTW